MCVGGIARDRQHLRVRRRADDDGLPPLLLRRGDEPVDALDGRAGRVDDLDRPREQRLIKRPRDAVRAHDDGRAVRNLFGCRDCADAQRLKMRNEMTVVGNGAEGHDGSPAPCSLLDQIDRAVHAVAESGGARLHDLHGSSPIA